MTWDTHINKKYRCKALGKTFQKKKAGAESSMLHSCWSGGEVNYTNNHNNNNTGRENLALGVEPKCGHQGCCPPPLRRWEEKVNLEPHRAGHHRRAHHHHYGRVSVKCHARGVRS